MSKIEIIDVEPQDIGATQETVLDADYLLIDGATNGTRKIKIENIVPPQPTHNYLYYWDFTKSLTDSEQGLIAEVKNGATFTVGTGVIINAYSGWLDSKCMAMKVGYTIEIDFSNALKNFSSGHGRFITSGTVGDSGFIYRSQTAWEVYRSGRGWRAYTQTSQDANIFSNKTLKMVFLQNEQMKVYAGDVLIYEGGSILYNDTSSDYLAIGSRENQNFYDMTITGIRVYANE